ncbi:hypothetical protein PRIPAC_88646 [Pristionchus pacificus]|uniref:Uncharacterized protein n=1 Tax=Pristionchus pacificus TaxID=54126 RepID=A0A2A6CV59_PRIPA|nr:hypothetical protein PRIPAC_88646 [Pristionchus pacificus]|eukprot:PDM82049.1 hypothetical protein PRIPAC_36442 [Pristionchus pacificus]
MLSGDATHDTTIGAYLTVLGAKTMVLPDGGYPVYSAAILTEFFIDRRAGGTDQVFRVIYHDSENTDFRVITPYVEGCKDDFCPVEFIHERNGPPERRARSKDKSPITGYNHFKGIVLKSDGSWRSSTRPYFRQANIIRGKHCAPAGGK